MMYLVVIIVTVDPNDLQVIYTKIFIKITWRKYTFLQHRKEVLISAEIF